MSDLFSHAPQAGSPLDELVALVDTLLSEGGCAWDREQTHESLVQYLLEESHELIDAIETGTKDDLREELGDVLYQVLFHARIAEGFDIHDVARETEAKMRRRHPHVFGDEEAETADDVMVTWEAAKAVEKADRTSVLDGVPQSLPALALADKVIGRAQKIGLLDAQAEAVVAVDDEQDLGRLLLTIVASAKANGLNAERALRTTLRDMQAEIRQAERDVADAGVIATGQPPE